MGSIPITIRCLFYVYSNININAVRKHFKQNLLTMITMKRDYAV